MRRWQSHKIVEAEPIKRLWPGRQDGNRPGSTIETADAVFSVDEAFTARGVPGDGDYLVRYADGYLSWSPKKAFEEGYTILEGARDHNIRSVRKLPEAWEYKIEGLPLHPNNFNDLGKDGWELVAALDERAKPKPPFEAGEYREGNRLFVFKRRLS